MHSTELHHFCTVSSPIFARSRKPPIDYQPLTKKIALRHIVPSLRRLASGATPSPPRSGGENSPKQNFALWTLELGARIWRIGLANVLFPLTPAVAEAMAGKLALSPGERELRRPSADEPESLGTPDQEAILPLPR